MSFFNRLMYRDDAELSPAKRRFGARAEPRDPGVVLKPTGLILSRDERVDDVPMSDNDIAAQLPPENTSISETGYMDSHRKPIVSINGRDIEEHDEKRKPAA